MYSNCIVNLYQCYSSGLPTVNSEYFVLFFVVHFFHFLKRENEMHMDEN